MTQQGFTSLGKKAGATGGGAGVFKCPACEEVVNGGVTRCKTHIESGTCSPKKRYITPAQRAADPDLPTDAELEADLAQRVEKRKTLKADWTVEKRRSVVVKVATVAAKTAFESFMTQQTIAMGEGEDDLTIAVRAVLMFIIMCNISLVVVESPYLKTLQ